MHPSRDQPKHPGRAARSVLARSRLDRALAKPVRDGRQVGEHLWIADGNTQKMLKYDLTGRLLFSWGTFGQFPGGFWGVHQFSVDSDGNSTPPTCTSVARRSSARRLVLAAISSSAHLCRSRRVNR